MGMHVNALGMVKCAFGAAPGKLMVLPITRELSVKGPGANITANVPMLNILPFGTCSSPSNPMVAAATAAALGVLTPMPCIPMTLSPWIPVKPKIMLSKMPILDSDSTCMCTWGGMIKITMPGQSTTSLG